MRILILGGTRFVGRAAVETLLAAGDDVTTLTSGRSGPPAAGARSLIADRHDPAAVAAALDGQEWDGVIDTWSLAPAAVRTTAALLDGRAGHYTYVSSRSVYTWPLAVGADESAEVVDGDPGSSDADDYAGAKRGGELAVLDAFHGPSLIARAGLVLGPYENVGRLPFWLERLAAGGQVPVPGPRERPLQYVDARDLAGWFRHAVAARVDGILDAVSPPAHTTMGALLDECNRVGGGEAELTWLAPETVGAAGVEPWTQLPIWVPPTGEYAGLHAGNTAAAAAAGLRCRPMEQTVADTWAWLRAEEPPARPVGRPGTPMGADDEARLWAAHQGSC